jgi:hypothetical protein
MYYEKELLVGAEGFVHLSLTIFSLLTGNTF